MFDVPNLLSTMRDPEKVQERKQVFIAANVVCLVLSAGGCKG